MKYVTFCIVLGKEVEILLSHFSSPNFYSVGVFKADQRNLLAEFVHMVYHAKGDNQQYKSLEH